MPDVNKRDAAMLRALHNRYTGGLTEAVMTPADSAAALKPANTEHRYEITRGDLPLCCPMPDMALWNSHPRVYLAIEDEGGESTCPYCGARYVLQG